MQQRHLDPATLAGISGLDLVAKTVVEGFVSDCTVPPHFGAQLRSLPEHCIFARR